MTRGVRPDAGAWQIRWTIANDGDEDLAIERAIAPHARFRADARELDLPVVARGEAELELRVHADTSGEEIENAFLILTARAPRCEWRILARLRVPIADGMPQPRTERIDVQEVGFSGCG